MHATISATRRREDGTQGRLGMRAPEELRDGPVGPGRLPKESTARSGFSCSSPELWKGRITNVYETLSPLEAGSGVSIVYSSLSLKERGGARMQAGEEIPSEIAYPDRSCRDGTQGRTHSPQAGERDRACESMVRASSTGPHALPPSGRALLSLRVIGAGRKDLCLAFPLFFSDG